jgi:hypothetical protein
MTPSPNVVEAGGSPAQPDLASYPISALFFGTTYVSAAQALGAHTQQGALSPLSPPQAWADPNITMGELASGAIIAYPGYWDPAHDVIVEPAAGYQISALQASQTNMPLTPNVGGPYNYQAQPMRALLPNERLVGPTNPFDPLNWHVIRTDMQPPTPTPAEAVAAAAEALAAAAITIGDAVRAAMVPFGQ